MGLLPLNSFVCDHCDALNRGNWYAEATPTVERGLTFCDAGCAKAHFEDEISREEETARTMARAQPVRHTFQPRNPATLRR